MRLFDAVSFWANTGVGGVCVFLISFAGLVVLHGFLHGAAWALSGVKYFLEKRERVDAEEGNEG
jgi:hypothetical protein